MKQFSIPKMSFSEKGFSLTELSVVIVVIALLTAGGFAGKRLIEASRVRAVISEVSQHKIAINSFYSQYEGLPGDFTKAEFFWGSGNTDNGNGNKQIGFLENGEYEAYHAWQHLSLAKIANGTFLGTETTGVAFLGSDVPLSRSLGAYYIDYNVFDMEDNVLILGLPAANTASPTVLGGILHPAQALSIDQKMDDSDPLSGIVRGDDDGDVAASAACHSGGVYEISEATKSCVMGFRLPPPH